MSDETAEPFPNFALEDLHRRTWTRADLAGHRSIVFCFATW